MGVLARNGVAMDEPCLFVLEGSLQFFDDEEATRLLRSLPRRNEKNLVVCSSLEARVLRWARDSRNHEAGPWNPKPPKP